MPRGLRQFITPRNALIACAVVAFVLSVAPAGAIRWTGWLAAPVELVVSPVQQPVAALVRWLTRSSTGPEAADPVLAELERQRDIWHRRYLAERETVRQLRERLADAERSRAINPGVTVRLINAPVIGEARGGGGRHLRARAGSREGVSTASVGVVRGVHLVGRVREVLPRTSLVLPITEPAAGQIQGVVMLDDETPGPAVLLEPAGDGTLVGRVAEFDPFASTAGADTEAVEAPDPEPSLEGALVRLSDAAWPDSAQMLVIGRIVKVGAMPDQPLRKLVTVKPELPIDRAAELTLRSPDLDSPNDFESGNDEGGGP